VTLIDQSMGGRIRRQTGRALAGLLGVAAIVHAAGADPKITCGSPTKSGYVNISINLKKGGVPHQILLEDIIFAPGTSGADKAAFISDLITMVLDPNGDYIVPEHAEGSSDVVLHPQNGWEIIGHGIMQDGTGEPDWVAYDGAATGGPALCSVSGTATGTSPTGGEAYVGIEAFGIPARCATSAGMPAQVVEGILMQQLQAQGVGVRWAQASDFEGPFEGMIHDDMVLFMEAGRGGIPVSIFESVADEGLQLDLAALAGPSGAPSSVGSLADVQGLRFEAIPTVFSGGPVSLRYSSARDPGSVRITVHDVTGRLVASLFQGPAGTGGTLQWDARDDAGRALPGGVYFLRFATPRGAQALRLTRVR